MKVMFFPCQECGLRSPVGGWEMDVPDELGERYMRAFEAFNAVQEEVNAINEELLRADRERRRNG